MQNSRPIWFASSAQYVRVCERNERILKRASRVAALLECYGLFDQLKVFAPRPAAREETLCFHGSEYLNFLAKASASDDPERCEIEGRRFGLGFDCPVSASVYEYATLIAGGTLSCVRALEKGLTPIAINPNGGWHHARSNSAAGYCYINDCVLGIMRLQRNFRRIFYLDLDAHHGDAIAPHTSYGCQEQGGGASRQSAKLAAFAALEVNQLVRVPHDRHAEFVSGDFDVIRFEAVSVIDGVYPSYPAVLEVVIDVFSFGLMRRQYVDCGRNQSVVSLMKCFCPVGALCHVFIPVSNQDVIDLLILVAFSVEWLPNDERCSIRVLQFTEVWKDRYTLDSATRMAEIFWRRFGRCRLRAAVRTGVSTARSGDIKDIPDGHLM
ncbi:unnamed protein product [Soboliphyme baturini]|uniref:Histone deacetylase 8 n=1 Tax=Soboliphyme baturini TaxID=241478 RepID=A0A183J2P9_9BILA|nr:unnamed protein product [Soboliphyme baturini]